MSVTAPSTLAVEPAFLSWVSETVTDAPITGSPSSDDIITPLMVRCADAPIAKTESITAVNNVVKTFFIALE